MFKKETKRTAKQEKAAAFGGILQSVRRTMFLTQKELAQISGIPKPSISAWERGVALPSPANINKLLAVIENEQLKNDLYSLWL